MINWNEMSAGEIIDAVEEAWNKIPDDARSYIELDWKMRKAELLIRDLDIVTAVSEYIDAVGWDGELTEDGFKSILLD